MDTLKFELNKKLYIPSYIAKEEVFGFLDIETDGLSSNYNKVVLIGLYIIDKDKQYIYQFFSESPNDEILVIKAFLREISNLDTIFTYNGNSFDIPFLKAKILKYNLKNPFYEKNLIDIFSNIKKNKDVLNISDCKLKTVEKKLDIHREDTITGKESIFLYKNYLKTKNIAYKKTILKHNYDDIYYLPNILSIEKQIPMSSIYNIFSNSKLFKVILDNNNIALKKNTLLIKGYSFRTNLFDYSFYDNSYTLIWDKESKNFTLEIFLIKIYKDLNSSFYGFDLTNSEFLNSIAKNYFTYDYLPKEFLILFEKDTVNFRNLTILLTNLFSKL